jgi:hypothetical protein
MATRRAWSARQPDDLGVPPSTLTPVKWIGQSGHMVQFLRRCERPPTGRATKAWLGSIHPTIVLYLCK